MWRRLTPLFLAPLLIASPVVARHVQPLDDGWVRFEMAAAGRPLAAVMPSKVGEARPLVVVIEGDGDGHDRHGLPTSDPTPRRAVGLQLAQAWPGGAAWLARPCQFVEDPLCVPDDWSRRRFAPEALAQINAGLDGLKARSGAATLVLVGWSGGGVMAALAAQSRDDVAGLVTIAAPLDLAGWTRSRGLSRLDGLDPATLPAPAIPQVHVLGSFDPVVRPVAVRETARRWAGPSGQVLIWPERHDCCWDRRLQEIDRRLRAQF